MSKSPESTYQTVAARIYETQLQQVKKDYWVYAAQQRRLGKEPESFAAYAQTRLNAFTPSSRS
jgi:hypothetical protein